MANETPLPPLSLETLFEDLMGNESHRERYNQLLARLLGTLATQIGTVVWVGGVPYVFDPVRIKQISAQRQIYMAGYYGQNQSDRFLKVEGVTTISNHGLLMPRDAVITGLYGKSRSAGSWAIEIKKNDNPTTLVSIPIVGSFGSNMNLNIDLNAGDLAQIKMVGSGVDHPVVGLEIAWRLP